MTPNSLCFTPALMLLLLTSPVWHVSQSLPVMANEKITESCVFYARKLLGSINDVLNQKTFTGIDCRQQGIELNKETNTSSVCAPKGTTCSGITVSEFNQDVCLKNIKEDLYYYYKFLAAQTNSVGLTTDVLKEVMEHCSIPLPTVMASEAPTDHLNTFDARLHLCKVLQGFRVRTITINRAIGYMQSEYSMNCMTHKQPLHVENV